MKNKIITNKIFSASVTIALIFSLTACGDYRSVDNVRDDRTSAEDIIREIRESEADNGQTSVTNSQEIAPSDSQESAESVEEIPEVYQEDILGTVPFTEYNPNMPTDVAYMAAISNLKYTGTFPDGEQAPLGDLMNSYYAIDDVDGDGDNELIIKWLSADGTEMKGIVYRYINDEQKMVTELAETPLLTVYDNGYIFAGRMDNSLLSEAFWPYNIYQYDAATHAYEYAGEVDVWDKSYKPKDTEGIDFPVELDTDNDGVLYSFIYGSDYQYGFTRNESDYVTFLGDVLGDSQLKQLYYVAFAKDDI